MKTDLYTKCLLTIIAICLIVLSADKLDIFPKAYANNIQNESSLLFKNYGLVPLNPDGSITVQLNSSEVDVNIVGIQTSDELDVNLDEVGGGYVPYGGPISVDID